MKRCRYCGASLLDNASRCYKCGRKEKDYASIPSSSRKQTTMDTYVSYVGKTDNEKFEKEMKKIKEGVERQKRIGELLKKLGLIGMGILLLGLIIMGIVPELRDNEIMWGILVGVAVVSLILPYIGHGLLH